MPARPATPKSPKVIGGRVLPFTRRTQRHHQGRAAHPAGRGRPRPPVGGTPQRDGRAARPQQPQRPELLVRRAVSLVLMTLVLPGSAHWVAGDRRVAKAAFGVAAGCLGLGLLLRLVAAGGPRAARGVLPRSTGVRRPPPPPVLAPLG